MSKMAFFYRHDELYDCSLKALKRRDYKIVHADETNGTITATYQRSLLNPKVMVEIKVEKRDEEQSCLNIFSKAIGGFFRSDRYVSQLEERLVSSLVKFT